MSREDMGRLVKQAHQANDERLRGYREQSLKIHPWVCARCGREFIRKNLRLLTVHHKDRNHENNPSDGSNWENLCVYCHDNEHSRYLDHEAGGNADGSGESTEIVTHKPFAALDSLLRSRKE